MIFVVSSSFKNVGLFNKNSIALTVVIASKMGSQHNCLRKEA